VYSTTDGGTGWTEVVPPQTANGGFTVPSWVAPPS
jgi:hypothetical protein